MGDIGNMTIKVLMCIFNFAAPFKYNFAKVYVWYLIIKYDDILEWDP